MNIIAKNISANTPLADILELGKVCNRKNNCCKHGSGFLVGDDLRNIAGFLGITEEELTKKYLKEIEIFNKKLLRAKLKKEEMPYGECIFFDGKGCSIHKVKPLHCKIGSCSEYGEAVSAWFLLNYIIDRDDAESIRQYALYLISGGKLIGGGKLEELIPDKRKLRKILRYDILK